MKTFYSAIFYLLIPFILIRLLWRSIKAPDYRLRWHERFGFYSKPMPQGVIWLHAVSVGEAEAAFPLVKRIQQECPVNTILITTTTPTGSARVQAVLGQTVEHVYLPYDLPDVVNRFMRTFKPKLAVILETELWPNLFAACGDIGIPLYVVNARLSEKSVAGYQKIPALIQPVLANIKQIAAQTQEDAERFIKLGTKPQQISVLGNIKYDLEIPETVIAEGKTLKKSAFHNRFVWLAASTHQGEEQLLFNIYQQLKPKIRDLLLLVVPRHPERFGDVAALCGQHDLAVVTRRSGQACKTSTDVYLADTMGELKMLYAAADIAFIGGSLVSVGGHNVLEALAVGVPALFGPYMANFKEIAEKVLAQKAAIQCQNPAELSQMILVLHENSRQRDELVAKGKVFLKANQGVLDKLVKLLQADLAVPKQ